MSKSVHIRINLERPGRARPERYQPGDSAGEYTITVTRSDGIAVDEDEMLNVVFSAFMEAKLGGLHRTSPQRGKPRARKIATEGS